MTTKKLVYTAVFLALGILFPMLFHLLGLPGQVLLPMHVPIFLGALTLGPISGFIVGILTPILSSLLTGMPPMIPMVPIMVFELAAYGFFAGFLYEKYPKNVFIPLIAAMIIGRIVAGIAAWSVFNIFNMDEINILTYISSSFVKGLPGIIMSLVLVPLLYKRMPVEVKNS
ncbi:MULTISPECIES: ECF transporter S component [Anaerococcus]|uniref:ECF transporter S component n=1 Tax=Anaerococcus TaxID=165779 RepID=UPI0027BAB2BC|nr:MULTISPECIES: ECF transporter S component [Anaerococcus]MDU2598588.1 ECF transporter S component [Anaerococcus sp.]MDU5229232.1 ECF transporter S component [Anaerococcus sp.]